MDRIPAIRGSMRPEQSFSLVVDFLLIAEFPTETITVQWSSTDFAKDHITSDLREDRPQGVVALPLRVW